MPTNRLTPMILDRLRAKPSLYRTLKKTGRLMAKAEQLAEEALFVSEQIQLASRPHPSSGPLEPGVLARQAIAADAEALDAVLPVVLQSYR